MRNKTDNKVTALYYRSARRGGNPEMHLDNQMQRLLCYAKKFHRFFMKGGELA
jgi:hypothetical protein